jgi:hypothetical protein
MSSFRAEACACLAGVCLLCVPTLASSNQAKNGIHTDSASLLARLARAVLPWAPLGFLTEPDSDLTIQIVEEFERIHELQRHHVKGRRDLAKPKQDCTLAEVHDIQADHEATKDAPFHVGTRTSRHRLSSLPSQWSCPRSAHQLLPQSIPPRNMHTRAPPDVHRQEILMDHHRPSANLLASAVRHPQETDDTQAPATPQRHLWMAPDWALQQRTRRPSMPTLLHSPRKERTPSPMSTPRPVCTTNSFSNRSIAQLLSQKQHSPAQPIRTLISQSLIQGSDNQVHLIDCPATHHSSVPHSSKSLLVGRTFAVDTSLSPSLITKKACFRARERPAEETGLLWAGNLIKTLWTFFFDTWKLRSDERHAQDEDHTSKQHTFRSTPDREQSALRC